MRGPAAPPERPRVLLKALGCRLNEAELEDWARDFRARGWDLAGDLTGNQEPADLIIINTCAVTAEAARKSLQWLRRTRRAHPRARLILCGCLATLEAADLTDTPGVDLLVANTDKDRLVDLVAAALNLPVLPATDDGWSAAPLFARGRQRAFVKVQDGCRHACTFCVTTLARGPERSRPLPEIVAAVARLAAAGVREVLLAGVHLGGYGYGHGLDLAVLVRTLLAETDIARLRLGSVEPWDLPDGLWDLFADPRLMPHLHLPMQSGADAVLRRMGRRCKSAEFARLAAAGRAAVPGLNLTTDIIAGFPGETAAEWAQTLAFVAAMGFGQVHGFAYSPRPGTRAAALPGQVDAATKAARVAALGTLAARLRAQVMAARVGGRALVLRESEARGGRPGDLFGYTPDYLPVRIDPAPQAPPVGEVMEVLIRGLDPDRSALRGTPGPLPAGTVFPNVVAV